MSIKVAIVTPASLRRPWGDSLRVLQQAHGLWEVGFRDFVLYSGEPDPHLPYDQEQVDVRGPAQFVRARRISGDLIHAHQNSGLFLQGRIWCDFHGYAPLESRANWRANICSPRAAAHFLLTCWATRRLLRKAERIICASASIEKNLRREHYKAPVTSVIRNSLILEDYPLTTCREPVVGVVGGFTSRWGRPSFQLALEVARLARQINFRFIGAISAEQYKKAEPLPNVEILGPVDDAEYGRFLQGVSIALLPFDDWCIGGGSRQKLLQAAASGQAIVSTPAGLDGFDAPGEALIGRNAQELVESLERLAANPAERRRRGLAVRAEVEKSHDFRREGERLAELYDHALDRRFHSH